MTQFPELNSLYNNTLGLSQYSYPNWDGGQCEPIDPHSIAKGLQFLEALSVYLIPKQVEPRPNGRIQYRWSNDKGDLLLEVIPHRDRWVYQFIPLNPLEPTRPQPVSSMTDFLTQILIPFLLPIKPVINERKSNRSIYQDMLPNP